MRPEYFHRRKSLLMLRLMAIVDRLEENSVETMIENMMERLPIDRNAIAVDQLLAACSRHTDPLPHLPDALARIQSSLDKPMRDADPGDDGRLIDIETPVKRWGANLPVTIIEAWEEFNKKVGSSRGHLISTALHAFMQLPHHRQSTAMGAYNDFKRKAATERGFQEAMAGLGFGSETSANGDDAEEVSV